MIEVRSEIDALTAALARLDNLDVPQLMKAAGAILEQSTRERFNTKLSPSGQPWAPVSDAYGDQKEAKYSKSRDDVLVRAGALRDTIHAVVLGDSVLVGSPMNYGAAHQFGVPGKLHARPFLGVSDQDDQDIRDLVEDWFNGAFKGPA